MNILILGGSSGIGKAFAHRLSKQNNVTVVSNNKNDLYNIKKYLSSRNLLINTEYADLVNAKELHKICEKYHDVDMVINSAGRGKLGDITSTDYEDEYGNISLNVTAFHYITKFFVNEMVKRKSGYIINVCSSASFVAMPNFSLYAATKAFCGSYTIAVARECKDTGVKIMALCPGTTRTKFLSSQEFQTIEKNFGFTGAIMKPSQVVNEALKALQDDKVICIPGIVNKVIYYFDKLMPCKLSSEIIYRLYRKINKTLGIKML